MDKMMVLVPTRSRPQNLVPIVDAWWKTGAFEVAQLRFVVDRDDAELDRYMELAEQRAEIVVDVAPEWQPLVPKLNEAAVRLAAPGDFGYFAFMGDDHIPRTPRWAHILVEQHEIRRHGKRQLLQYGRDGFQDEKLPTWWSVHRDWIQALGTMVPAPIQHLYCDNTMLEVGRAAGTMHYNPEVLVEHMHPIVRKGRLDHQYLRVNSTQQYRRDGLAFETWMRTGLSRAVTLLLDVAGG